MVRTAAFKMCGGEGGGPTCLWNCWFPWSLCGGVFPSGFRRPSWAIPSLFCHSSHSLTTLTHSHSQLFLCLWLPLILKHLSRHLPLLTHSLVHTCSLAHSLWSILVSSHATHGVTWSLNHIIPNKLYMYSLSMFLFDVWQLGNGKPRIASHDCSLPNTPGVTSGKPSWRTPETKTVAPLGENGAWQQTSGPVWGQQKEGAIDCQHVPTKQQPICQQMVWNGLNWREQQTDEKTRFFLNYFFVHILAVQRSWGQYIYIRS